LRRDIGWFGLKVGINGAEIMLILVEIGTVILQSYQMESGTPWRRLNNCLPGEIGTLGALRNPVFKDEYPFAA